MYISTSNTSISDQLEIDSMQKGKKRKDMIIMGPTTYHRPDHNSNGGAAASTADDNASDDYENPPTQPVRAMKFVVLL